MASAGTHLLMTVWLAELWTLCSCLVHQYHFVYESKNWQDAQRYCRNNYKDLATVTNLEENNQIVNIMNGYNGIAWVGLYNDVNSWRWSLSDSEFYGQGESEFRMWDSGQPDNYLGRQTCGLMRTNGQWDDDICGALRPFICYDQRSADFMLISNATTWSDAQRYCREKHTDLASVRNQTENERVQILVPSGSAAWIGLFRDDWKWSDGSNSTYEYWFSGEPNNYGNRQENCGELVMFHAGRWNDEICSYQLPFVCYSETSYTTSSPRPTQSTIHPTQTALLSTFEDKTSVADVPAAFLSTAEGGFALSTALLSISKDKTSVVGLSTAITSTLEEGSGEPEAHVICTEHFMAIELEKSDTIRLHEDHLRLNDPNCTLYSNSTHVLANMSLSTCGTIMEDDGEYLIFRNEVVSFDDLSDIITRRHNVEIEFFCKYPKQSQVTVEFDAHRPPLTFIQRGFGTFTFQFEFFESDQFSQEKDPNTYPLEFDLGDMMYMQIESISSVPNTELFAESCSAAPSDHPDEAISYQIIQNGCKMDESVQFYSSHQSKVQLAIKAFKFIGLHDQVFITCSVILCQAGVPGSRCSQGCTNSSASGRQISKRKALIQSAKHYISQGPLRLRRDVASTVAINTVDLNLVFVVEGLLAAVAMVCGMLIYKSRGSKVKYERVLSSDI